MMPSKSFMEERPVLDEGLLEAGVTLASGGQHRGSWAR